VRRYADIIYYKFKKLFTVKDGDDFTKVSCYIWHNVQLFFVMYTVSQKNRTPITFWNNSNKLCLIIIMISWENCQKVLNIVVCYRLMVFHKTGYQLRLAALGGGLVWPTADRCRWRNRRIEKTSLLLLRRMVKLQQVEDSWPVVVVDMPAVLSA